MERIFISMNDLKELKPINIYHHSVCKYPVNNDEHILKRLESKNVRHNRNTIYTVEELNRNYEILPVEFCIPDFLVDTEYGIRAFTVPMVHDSLNLDYYLKSKNFSHQEKIEILKKFGSLLRKCDELRKIRHMRHFAICDVQEENIMVNPFNKEIKIVDMDTCRIGRGLSSQAKYLTPYSLAMHFPEKYSGMKGFGYVDADRESDLFCYIIIILNYLSESNIANLDPEEFYNYINYLDYIGINQELLNAFCVILTRGSNVNPDYLLDSIDEKTLEKARYS